MRAKLFLGGGLALLFLASPRPSLADGISPADSVDGPPVVEVGVGATDSAELARVPWSSLATTDVPAGPRWVTFSTPPRAEAVFVPPCAGRTAVLLDGRRKATSVGPVVVDLPRDGSPHRVGMSFDVSAYEHRIPCGMPPRTGHRTHAAEGLLRLDFVSPHARSGGGHAVVFIPPGHDASRPATLLVGLHPWNGGIWTYAAYEPLLDAASVLDVLLLFPSGLGNSLYTADAEDEVLVAIKALEASLPTELAIDPDRVSLWGASMGGAGATTIGFHHPDRFAAVVSLFGDSQYDLTTYVRGILHDAHGAHLVNALDIADNARNLPVWLVHGTVDRVSPFRQSADLARALQTRGFSVRFDPVPGAGHEGRVVSQFAARIVDFAASARRVTTPSRVSYRSVRPSDTGAYGVRIERTSSGEDSFIDIVRDGSGVHVLSAEGIRALHLAPGALATDPAAPPAVDGAGAIQLTWDRP